MKFENLDRMIAHPRDLPLNRVITEDGLPYIGI
jgi:hypothetical protein